jgi:hypothetical protein
VQAEPPTEVEFPKWRIGLFLVLAAGLIGALMYKFSDPYTTITRNFPDGSTLRILGVSYGSSNYYGGPKAKPWQLAIGRKLPFSLASRLDWWFKGGDWFQVVSAPGYSNLTIVVARDGPGRAKAAKFYRMVLFDGESNGVACRGSGSSSGDDSAIFKSDTPHFHLAQSMSFAYYPRRDKNIILRFFEDHTNGEPPKVVAEFHVPNPCPGSYPTWTPEPLPTFKAAGDVVATLADFATGVSRAHPERAARDNEESVTHVAFRLEQSSQTNCLWAPVGIEVSDATGNRWPVFAWPSKPGTNAVYNMNFADLLWAGESAWKLKIELSRTNGFESNDLWIASSIPVPSQSAPSEYFTNIDGCAVSISLSFARKTSRQPTSRFVPATLQLTSTNIPLDMRLSLVSAIDDQGGAIKIKSHSTAGKEEHYGVAIPADAKRLDCVCAYHKSRFVEFVAAPRRE